MGDLALLDRLLAEAEEDRRRIQKREQVLRALRDSTTRSGDSEFEVPKGTAAIVAATVAHGFFLRNDAYVCQPYRSFNNNELSHVGFYADQKIQREIPKVIAR